jgi:hypothetical protein
MMRKKRRDGFASTSDRLLLVLLCFSVGLFNFNAWGILLGLVLRLWRLLLWCRHCLGWLLLCTWQEKTDMVFKKIEFC